MARAEGAVVQQVQYRNNIVPIKAYAVITSHECCLFNLFNKDLRDVNRRPLLLWDE
jgi:hypothetical protein